MKSLIPWLLAGVLFAGCRPAQPTSGRQTGSTLAGRNDRGASLLSAAADQLNDLPSFVDTKLRTPTVVLDARKSSDGNEILAVCTSNPKLKGSPFSVLLVPANNSRFQSLRIRPGDIVKYFVRVDPTQNEQSMAAGMGNLLPIDLTVAQVLDEHALLVEESLKGPIDFPAKLEIWRFQDDRMVDIAERLKKYHERRLPELGWEPSPDEQALTKIVDWLNQWSRQSKPLEDFHVDPLVGSLDSALVKDEQLGPRISATALAAREFVPYQGRLLQEAIWLRDISRWAQGNKFDDVSKAQALFDWTVRNIQLEADEDAAPHRPWQALVYGRGTAAQRAWVFALLCRQQGLEVVVLSPVVAKGGEGAAGKQKGEAAAVAAAAVLPAVLTEGKLHVFDARLGLPIRGPEGAGVATLEQLGADDALLRRLDLPDSPYPLAAADCQRVTANVVADEFDLSQAALQLERKLTAQNRLVLSANASEVAGHVKSLPGVAAVRLWDVPFRTLRDQLNLAKPARLNEALSFEPFAWRPTLWKARVLQFQGRRPTADARTTSAAQAIDSHAEATQLFSGQDVRPSPRDPAWASPDKQRIAVTLQMNAAYWVGLLLYDEGKYDVATHWFKRPELKRPDSPWIAGARYNLGRAQEALGNRDEAIKLYEADTSPQRQGNRLRAKWLREEKGE